MARGDFALQTFNRGRISKLALARTDLDRTRVSAETQTNWIPRTLGSMMVRPGLGYIGEIPSECRLASFVFATTDTALIEITGGQTRVWVDDALVQRPGSTAVVTDFTSTSLAGWTDADEAGATSEWLSGNYLGLTGTRFARAIRRQQVVCSVIQTHGLTVKVDRGAPVLKVGSSLAGDDYFSETTLRPGSYSLAIPATGDFHIELSANTEYTSRVESISIDSSGPLTVANPWASTDLDRLRWAQEQDVTFVSAYGYRQQRIERYGTESWAVVDHAPEDGPFRTINITNKRLSPSGLTGNISLLCDQPLFKPGHAGALYQVTSIGQQVKATITGADQFSDSIRVSGVQDSRKFQVLVSAISTDITVRVQRSIGEEGSWGNVSGLSYTATIDSTHDDGLDNQIVYYRIGSGSTDLVSTSTAVTASVELGYASGGITGIARITSVLSATESSAIVLTPFGSTAPSELWSEGAWSTLRGYPSAVTLHEGRLCWAGKARFQGSVSDAFDSHDVDIEGDSGPLNLAVGEGPSDVIQWMASLTRLVLGAQGDEKQAKTSSLEEPLTPTNFALRPISGQGSASVQAVKIDQRLYHVQLGGVRLMEIRPRDGGLDYDSFDRTILIPEIGQPSIVRLAAQRQPDTRLHCVRSDGTVGMLIADPAEDVLCWIDINSTGAEGAVEEVAVLPGSVERTAGQWEDSVYYVVRREINGSTKRFLEKWAQEDAAKGGSTNSMADAFQIFNSTATTTITGADHLVGESVSVWGAGKDLGSYTVSSTGEITGLSEASTTFVYGLKYPALFKSAKLAYLSQTGTALTKRKKIDHVGIVAADLHAQGLQFGPSTDALDPLPIMERAEAISSDTIWSDYDADPIEFPGSWDTDSRLVLYGESPRPATVLGAIVVMDTRSKT